VILEDDDAFQECFRFYEDSYESYVDHSNFLLSSNRYAYLFDLEVTDYRSWAYGLKEAGYATSPTYASQLIEIIEKYNLKQYDHYVKGTVETKEKEEKHEVILTNGVASTKAKEGDSYTKIAIENKMKVSDLLFINDLSEIKDLRYGDIVFIKPKKNENRDYETHVVRMGESMHDIAQLYGVKLNVLLERNGLKAGEEPSKGETISINKKNKKEVKKRTVYRDGTQMVNMHVNMGDRNQSDSIIEAKFKTEVTNSSKVDKALAAIPVSDTEEVYKGNINKREYGGTETEDKLDEVISSEDYFISAEELILWNKIKDNNIKIDQRLRVTDHETNNNALIKTYSMNEKGIYTVQDGDSLEDIAAHFSLSMDEIIDMNLLIKPYIINTGDKLKVAKQENTKIYRPPFHVVKGGDTLESISRKYEMSVSELKRLNSLADNKIRIGEKLVLQ
jgi:LysM repeat protein